MGSPGERPRWAGEPSTISQQPAMGRGGPKGSSGGSALKQKKKEGEKSSSIARQARRPPAAQTTRRKAAALIGAAAGDGATSAAGAQPAATPGVTVGRGGDGEENQPDAGQTFGLGEAAMTGVVYSHGAAGVVVDSDHVSPDRASGEGHSSLPTGKGKNVQASSKRRKPVTPSKPRLAGDIAQPDQGSKQKPRRRRRTQEAVQAGTADDLRAE